MMNMTAVMTILRFEMACPWNPPFWGGSVAMKSLPPYNHPKILCT